MILQNIKNKDIHQNFKKLDQLLIKELPHTRPLVHNSQQAKQIKQS
jgi:hypothetical protein